MRVWATGRKHPRHKRAVLKPSWVTQALVTLARASWARRGLLRGGPYATHRNKNAFA